MTQNVLKTYFGCHSGNRKSCAGRGGEEQSRQTTPTAGEQRRRGAALTGCDGAASCSSNYSNNFTSHRRTPPTPTPSRGRAL